MSLSFSSPEPQIPEFVNRTLAHLAAAAVIGGVSFFGGYLSRPTEVAPIAKIERCEPAKRAQPWPLSILHRPPAD